MNKVSWFRLFFYLLFLFSNAQKYKDLTNGHQRSVNGVAFLDTNQVFSIGSDGKFLLWNIRSKSFSVLYQHKGALFSIDIGLPYIAIGDRFGIIHIFKQEKDSIIPFRQKQLHSSGIDHISFGAAHNQVLSVSYDGNAYIWDFINDWLQHLHKSPYPLYTGLFVDQDRITVIGGKERILHFFQTENQFSIKTFQLHGNTIRCLAYDPSHNLLASGDLDGKVILYQLNTLQIHAILAQLPQKPVRTLLFSPDGSYLFIGYSDGEICVLQVENEKVVHWLKNPSPLWDIAISPNGKALASALADGTIRIWELSFLKFSPQPVVSSRPIPPPENIENDIPQNPNINPHRYALIIGNEFYTHYQKDLNPRMDAAYARADASLFSIYAEKVLGVPSHQILLGLDVAKARFQLLLNKLASIVANDTLAEIYFFYAGHGLPDPTTKKPYLLPIDISPNEASLGIELQEIIDQLSRTRAKRVFLFVDACFSGGSRSSEDLIQHRGIYIKPKTLTLPKNTILFSASTENERALAFPEAKHGLFTYFLLKALKHSTLSTTYEYLVTEVTREVNKYAILIHNLAQHPTLLSNDPDWNTWVIW
jgi:hypothetical protein